MTAPAGNRSLARRTAADIEQARQEAIGRAGQVLANARAERAAVYATGGAQAVAAWVAGPGCGPDAEVAATYQQWVDDISPDGASRP